MIRVAVVEDDPRFSNQIREFLRRYELENGEEMRVSCFSDGDEILERYKAEYDLLLMDIEMTFVDGMTAARAIRTLDQEVTIVFITNMPQYAMEGYKVEAMDYLLKPVKYFAFSAMMDRAVHRARKKEDRYIKVPIKGGFQRLKTSSIIYVEVSDHDLIYHTANGDVPVKSSMREAEELLAEEQFFRCHKMFLINLNHVERIQENDVQVGDAVVMVSRNRKKPLMEALNRMMNEVET